MYSEAYPEYEVVDIQFAYNLSKLIKLDRARYYLFLIFVCYSPVAYC